MNRSFLIKSVVLIIMLASSLFAGWQLAWSDSFSVNGLPDSKKWAYETGASGWGNNELENYTASRLENARVDSGNLIIEARNDNYQNHQYSSVRMHSIGTGNWTYGRFEIRAKLPFGKGTWPALWMMPTSSTYGGWPSSGEIDIMEHVGSDQGVIHFSTHCQKYYFRLGNQKTATKKIADCSTAFHVYAMEWNADTIRGYIDTSLYFTNVNEHSGWQAWPFDKPFHFIFNIAIGGDWGGTVDNTIFPQRMYVDYANVYSWSNSNPVLQRPATEATRSLCLVREKGNAIEISMPLSGPYRVDLIAINGRTVASVNGAGALCAVGLAGVTPGVYTVQAFGTWGSWKRSISLMR
jgi:beta-glucanase (GH16 family)